MGDNVALSQGGIRVVYSPGSEFWQYLGFGF